MKRYELQITLKSPALIGSGEGSGSLIDSDIVFDDIGIPYIPSKRIKGCLRDSAIEICEMFKRANLPYIDLGPDDTENGFRLVSGVFGKPGQEKPASVFFSNLTIEDYEANRDWFIYLINEYKGVVSRESLIDTFTELRQQTAIDEESGTAEEHSLRTIRVAKEGIVFTGAIDVESDNDDAIKLLSFACKNLRRFGTKRNRGFGEIECKLFENSKEINFINELEVLCR